MADANSTSINYSDKFPMNGDPYGIWYDPDARWVVNNADGHAIAEVSNYEDAFAIADALRLHDPSQPDNRRTGGLAGMLALCNMETIATTQCGKLSEDYLGRRKEAMRAVTKAASPLPPFLEGFVETLAHYAHDSLVVGAPNLFVWKSDAAMTAQERDVYRAMLAADKEVAHV